MAGNDIRCLHTSAASNPGGHYSQAVRHENTLYISGQLPVRADGSHSMNEAFDVQAQIALQNLGAILLAAGCSTHDLLKVTVYVVGIQHWPAFDRLYAQWAGEHRPARAVVPVPELHHGYLVEIEALARVAG